MIWCTASQNDGTELISKVADAVRVKVPLTPVIVTVNEPGAALEAAVNVIVDEFPVVLLGLKLAVTPEGRPEMLRLTAEPNPLNRLMARVLELVVPGARIRFAEGVSEKSPLL